MDTSEAIAFVDRYLVAQYTRRLSAAERLVLLAAWEDRTYREVAQDSEYSLNTLQRAIAPGLWSLLSELFRQSVGKKNFRRIIVGVSEVPFEPDGNARSSQIIGMRPLNVAQFYGRQRELADLQRLGQTYRCITILGVEGIGKRSLVAKFLQAQPLPFDRILWKSLHYQPTVEHLIRDILGSLAVEPDTLQDLHTQFSQLSHILEQKCLLIFDGVEVLLSSERNGYKCFTPGYLSFFRRILEETKSNLLLLTQDPLSEVEALGFHGFPTISYSLGSLAIEDAKQIFVEFELADQPLWEEIIQAFGGNPFLLRQFASWSQSRLGGSLRSIGRTTVQMGIVQYWFDQLFEDYQRLSCFDRQVLVQLAQLLASAQTPVTLSEFVALNQNSVRAVDRLTQLALVQISYDATRQEQLLSMSPLLQKYILKDPCGLVQSDSLIGVSSLSSPAKLGELESFSGDLHQYPMFDPKP